ncbi:MAG: flagellar biosynthesis protein FlhF [Dehalobacterium sp.]
MKIKKYLVENMSEAIKVIKNDLGSEAVIISSRKVRQKGVLSFFRPRLLEVTAAVDKTVERNRRDIFPQESNFKIKNEKKEHDYKKYDFRLDKKDNYKKEQDFKINDLKEDSTKKETGKVDNLKEETVKENSIGTNNATKKDDDLVKEITEIKSMLEQFTVRKKTGKGTYRNEHLSRWQQDLLDWGISEELCKILLKGIKIKGFEDQEAIDNYILEAVKEKVNFLLKEIYGASKQKKILAFIGPTGVGKTTTIAKIAARFALFQHKKVSIITIDTYRIGAVEQIKTYGEIIGVSVEVVMTPEELREAVDKNSDKDVILIDTSGRSYKNAMQLRMLKGFLEKIPQGEVYLVLSSSTKERDLIHNVEKFGLLGFSRFIFTKTDETDSLGTILSLMLELKIPVEYITNGQNVPDDIKVMNPEKLAGMVLGGEFIERSSRKVTRSNSVSF